jgi:phosphoglycolate phosphatase-like HAD superfamily hydrolase
LRIAFDLDGVLADLHGPYVRMATRLFPRLDPKALGAADIGASPDDPGRTSSGAPSVLPASRPIALSADQSRDVWRTLAGEPNFWETVAECEPGMIARLASLAAARGWEVLFITSRPASTGRTVQRQSQRWLQRHGFDLPSVYVVHGSRGQIAAALHLDVVVDDRPENCLDIVLESRAGAILIWRGDADSVPASAQRLGIATVSTVGACLDALVAAEDAGAAAGLLERLHRLLGLQTHKSAGLFRDRRTGS